MVNSPSDEELMSLYRKRADDKAFAELYKRHSGKIYAYLSKRLENRSECDEVFQAVFLKFHQARHQYDPKYPVLQWLFVVSKTVLVDHYRKKGRGIEEVSGYTMEDIPAKEAFLNPEDILQSLAPENRQIVEWRVLNDLSYAEIAQRLNRTETGVRQIFSRSIRSLKEKKL